MNDSTIEKKTGYHVPYWWYDIRGFFIFLLCYQDFLPKTIHFFAKNISQKHLEVAIGSGSFFKLCLIWAKILKPKEIFSGAAFDYTPDMLYGAKKMFHKDNSWNIEQADVTNLKYVDNEFSTVNIANAFHCFVDMEKAMKELHRVLQPKGILAVNIITPPRGNFLSRWIAEKILVWGKANNIVERSISHDEMIKLFSHYGFNIISKKWKGNNLLLLAQKC